MTIDHGETTDADRGNVDTSPGNVPSAVPPKAKRKRAAPVARSVQQNRRKPHYEIRRELPDTLWVRLSDAVCFLLYGAVIEQTNKNCFSASDKGLAQFGSVLFGLAPRKHPSAIHELEVTLCRAARGKKLHFRGVKTGIKNRDCDSPSVPTDEEIPETYFWTTRGFDWETSRINIASPFGDLMVFHSAYDIAFAAPIGAYFEWTNVTVEKSSFVKWRKREMAVQQRVITYAADVEVRALLIGYKQQSTKDPTHRVAERLRRDAGLQVKQIVLRRTVRDLFGAKPPGRPRETKKL